MQPIQFLRGSSDVRERPKTYQESLEGRELHSELLDCLCGRVYGRCSIPLDRSDLPCLHELELLPEILPSSIRKICLIGADAGQWPVKSRLHHLLPWHAGRPRRAAQRLAAAPGDGR
jgi:hypothetical protein